MRGSYVIHDKATGTFWTGREWNRHHDEAKMFHQADEAIAAAKVLQGAEGPVEVLEAWDYANPRVVWSSRAT